MRGFSAEYIGEFEARYSKYYGSLESITLDYWGVGYKKGSAAHFTKMQHPMESFEDIEEFKGYPYPDPVKDFDWSVVSKKADELKKKDRIAVAHMEMTIFIIAW